MYSDPVLVLGATGLVGPHLVRELLAAGESIVAVSRRPPNEHDDRVVWVKADLTRAEDVARIPACTRAISTLAIWMTADLVPDLVERGLKRLVCFSSTSAVTKVDAADAGERKLAASLARGEESVRSHSGLTSTILRPTMIYGGPGDANVERIAKQVTRLHVFPLVGRGDGLRQPVHAADLGAAAARALQSDAAMGGTYALSGGEVLTVRQMVHRIAQANAARVLFVRVPMRPAEVVLRVLGALPRIRKVPNGALARMTRDLVFDHEEATKDFDYHPRPFDPPDYRISSEC